MMPLMRYRWKLIKEHRDEEVREFSQRLDFPLPLAQVMLNRGVRSIEGARAYLKPQWSDLRDPFLLPGVEEASERIISALKVGERMMIFGDYDVDGLTATALLSYVLKARGGDVTTYIPNRLIEGYGLSLEGVKAAQERGVSLLITVDCGITASQEVRAAKELGVEVIVTDHHYPQEEFPPALVVIDPKAGKVPYIGGELAGVGVAFKLAQGIYRKLGRDDKPLQEHLDLVALGTVADMVPLTLENRILAKQGLRKLAHTGKQGLMGLIVGSGLSRKGRLTTYDVGFVLGPRINAAGRLGDAQKALGLLTVEDEGEAERMALFLEEANERRRRIEEETLTQARAQIKEEYDLSQVKGLVLAAEGWHPGVLGIVASKLVEEYGRPTVLLAWDGGQWKGSARSTLGFHLFQALSRCGDLLLSFGGHRFAGGLSLRKEDLSRFKGRFLELTDELLSPEDLIPLLKVDSEVNLSEVDKNWVKLLRYMEPFGPENPQPLFLSRNLEVVGYPRVVGRNHLKFKVRSGQKIFEVLAFKQGEHLRSLEVGRKDLSMVFSLAEDVWNGRAKVQLRAKDIQFEMGRPTLSSS